VAGAAAAAAAAAAAPAAAAPAAPAPSAAAAVPAPAAPAAPAAPPVAGAVDAAAAALAPAAPGATVEVNGVTVPAAVKRQLDQLVAGGLFSWAELGNNVSGPLSDLARLAEVTAVEALENFARADQSQIRNKTGFLMGIIRRFQQRQAAFGGTGATPGLAGAGGAAAGSVPWPAVQAAVDALVASGKLRRGELQDRCFDELRVLGEALAAEVVEKFSEVDLSGIGNKTGFFMGICRRYRDRATQGAMRAAPAYTGVGPAGADAQGAFGMLPVVILQSTFLD